MNRPTCGTCPLYAPVNEKAGECLHEPPEAMVVPTPMGRPMVQGVSPPVYPSRPSCSHHPRMTKYAEWFDGQAGPDEVAGNPKDREVHRKDGDGGPAGGNEARDSDDGRDGQNGQRVPKSLIVRP